MAHGRMKGRASAINPPNRFVPIHAEDDFDHREYDEDFGEEAAPIRTDYFADSSKSIVTENDSPDVGARYSLNPYRGCSHGCAYCYARPTHEYLGLSAGLDFETKVFLKQRAPELFRDWLARADWQPEPIMLSGVTDCYQPAERQFRLTRQCLEVALEARQPINIVTKNALVTRDLDLLAAMAARRLVKVAVSITTLDQSLTKAMEPRTSSPVARLKAVETLSSAGIPVHIMVAPIVPGLTDSEIPAILQEARSAGAETASYVLLRLPLTVRPVFLDWLQRNRPHEKERILSRIRSTRDGSLYRPSFGTRMKGTGPIAEQIGRTFHVFSRRCGLDQGGTALDATQFRPPASSSGQKRLF